MTQNAPSFVRLCLGDSRLWRQTNCKAGVYLKIGDKECCCWKNSNSGRTPGPRQKVFYGVL